MVIARVVEQLEEGWFDGCCVMLVYIDWSNWKYKLCKYVN